MNHPKHPLIQRHSALDPGSLVGPVNEFIREGDGPTILLFGRWEAGFPAPEKQGEG